MYLCVISVLLCFIPRLLLVAVARLAVSCGLQAGGVRPFSAQLQDRCEEAYALSQG